MKLTSADKQMLREQYEKVWGGDTRMVDYCVKRASGYIEIGGIIVVYDKPHIETSFCFGEHGYDYDEVNELCHELSSDEGYFKAKNMRHVLREIKALKDSCNTAYVCYHWRHIDDESVSLGHVETWRGYDKPRNEGLARVMTEAEKEAYIAFLDEEAQKFGKRLDTYLKRYGMSKCHFWTYWADR